jgi:hypothetical protein
MKLGSLAPLVGEGRSFWINLLAGLIGAAILAIGSWYGYLFIIIPVPLWLFLILSLLGAGTIIRIKRTVSKPSYARRYRKDIIDGIGWQWDYNENGRPINAEPFCSKCGTPAQIQILKQLSGPQVASAYCPNCNKPCQQIAGIDSPDDLRDVHAVPKIRQKIATDTWPRS